MRKFLKMLSALLVFELATTAQAQSSDWRVSDAAGSVTITVAGQARPATRGAVLGPGATVATGPGSRAVVVHDRDFVTVSPNSRLRIPAVAERRGLFQVVQEWGNALFQIEKQTSPHFGVQTPYLAAVVKGTTFSITVTSDGASLQVVEGAVETSTNDGGASEIIRPGVVATVRSGDVFRLTVQGQDVRQIDSPQRAVQSGLPAAAPAATQESNASTRGPGEGREGPGTHSSNSLSSDSAGAAASRQEVGLGGADFDSQVIFDTIVSKPVDLGQATAGLIGGTNATQLAGADAVAARDAARAVADDRGSAAAASGNSGAADAGGNAAVANGSNAANGNANANGSANGNGSAIGVVDSVTDSLGSGDAAVDVGTGNSGSGNGNAIGIANGNGNANGIANGNGNANGIIDSVVDGLTSGNAAVDVGTGNSGSGNGNGNGIANENGNASGIANGNGNANGIANGNGNANGIIDSVVDGLTSGNATVDVGTGKGNGSGNGDGDGDGKV